MATLRQEPLSFPWEMFMQAQQEKNKNQRLMFKDIEGMGTGLGQIGQDITAIQEKKKMDDFMKQFQAALMGQGSQPAPAPMPSGPGGGIPGGPTQNMTPQQPMSQGAGMMPQSPPQPMGQSDLGRLSALGLGAGLKDNPFMEQFAKSMNPTPETAYQKAALEEKARDSEANRQIKILSIQMQEDIAAGRRDDALSKLKLIEEGINQRDMASKRSNYQKRLADRNKQWWWKRDPLPPDPDAPQGALSPQEMEEYKRLHAKFGGKNP